MEKAFKSADSYTNKLKVFVGKGISLVNRSLDVLHPLEDMSSGRDLSGYVLHFTISRILFHPLNSCEDMAL